MPRVKRVDLVYHYGDNFDDLVVHYTNADGSDYNLTNHTAEMQIRDDEGTLLLTLQTSNGSLTIPTPTDGRIYGAATPTQMLAGSLEEGRRYSYDLQIATGSSFLKTILKGVFLVDPQVTQ